MNNPGITIKYTDTNGLIISNNGYRKINLVPNNFSGNIKRFINVDITIVDSLTRKGICIMLKVVVTLGKP